MSFRWINQYAGQTNRSIYPPTAEEIKEHQEMIKRTVNAGKFPASSDRLGWAQYYAERNEQMCFWYLLLIESEV